MSIVECSKCGRKTNSVFIDPHYGFCYLTLSVEPNGTFWRRGCLPTDKTKWNLFLLHDAQRFFNKEVEDRSMEMPSLLALHKKCYDWDGQRCGHIKWDDNGTLEVCGMYEGVPPIKQWGKIGGCAGRTHMLPQLEDKSRTKRINPLKGSKRAEAGVFGIKRKR